MADSRSGCRPDTLDDGPGGFFSGLAGDGHAASIATSSEGHFCQLLHAYTRAIEIQRMAQ